ncbi:uncharacterized protein LOC144440361 [Glandiceps talaboti]
MFGKLTILIVLVSVAHNNVMAIECYDCVSTLLASTGPCDTPTSQTATTTCSGQCEIIHAYAANILTITRTCSESCTSVSNVINLYGIKTGSEIECCSDNHCTGSLSSGDDGTGNTGNDGDSGNNGDSGANQSIINIVTMVTVNVFCYIITS